MPPRANPEAEALEDNGVRDHGMRRVTSESSMSDAGSPACQRTAQDYRMRKSSLIGMIDWTHVLFTHAPLLMVIGILILFGQIVHQVVTTHGLQDVAWSMQTMQQIVGEVSLLFISLYESIAESRGFSIFSPAVKTTALVLLIMTWILRRQGPVYLLSFATFKAPQSWKVTHDELMEIMRRQKCFTDESLEFLSKILQRSGTGQATAWPPGIVQCLENKPTDRSIEASRAEAEAIIFDVVEKALKRANVKPREIDYLIINCSLFSPTPSLCAMVLSKFDMRSNVATYNLSGMGCSASLISIDLAEQLLRSSHRNSKALVVSTEILTPNFYHGNERGFLIQNTLFRCGGAAMVLSNSWFDGKRALYKLLHTVRVQGTGEAAYQCVYEGEDSNGERGVRLSKDIVKVAGKCMEKNFTRLGPLVLPLTEQALVVFTIATRFLLKQVSFFLKAYGQEEMARKMPSVKPYVPDFKTGIDHFCIHAGGRAVIDGIEKNMKLEPFHTEASRMTLLNYGNTSSSSIWYELEYIEEHQKTNTLKKGDRVLQVAFGSGFKCTSAVWLKL